ncbi:MAG: DUF1707 domain-containing protein [Gemmatimonadota bacterium]|nr:DUF1707 domain-containing protein [Gemmatimonadota bacterium]
MSLEQERERVVEALSAHFAADHLSTQELEARFERAYRARTLDELRDVAGGLPALAHPARPPTPRPSAPAPERTSVAGERRYTAIMSAFRRDGEWTPNRHTVLLAVMSEARIDLRDATFVDREIKFDVKAVMADVRILVPPGVTVECDGGAFMGEFSGRHQDAGGDPEAPRVVVTGSAIMAKVSVETRLPGESRLAAWRRSRRLRGGRDD